MVPSVEPGLGTQKEPWRGPSPDPAGAVAHSVSSPLDGVMVKTRITSAPRSALSRNLPVGSVKVECGCGLSWRSVRGPLPGHGELQALERCARDRQLEGGDLRRVAVRRSIAPSVTMCLHACRERHAEGDADNSSHRDDSSERRTTPPRPGSPSRRCRHRWCCAARRRASAWWR